MSSLHEERFDPIKGSQGNQYNFLGPMFDSFMRINKQGDPSSEGVVERWDVASDGLSWTLYLRKGLKFHNGEDLKADDVKFSIERYMKMDAMYNTLRVPIQRIEQVDDYTVRLYTNGQRPFIADTLATGNQALVMPKDYIERQGIEYFERHPVGSGPFKFARYVPGDLVEYEALNTHWRQVPAFKKLTIMLIPEETTRLAMLKTGAIDGIDIGPESQLDLDKAGFKTFSLEFQQAEILLHGAYDPRAASMPIADVRVRQALSLAIDREAMLKDFFYNKANFPLISYVQTGTPGLDVAYWKEYSKKALRYDLNEAKRLMKEAGYPNGFSIKVWSCTVRGAPYLPKMAEVVQGYWSQIGVKAELVPVDFGTYTAVRNTDKSPQLLGAAGTYRSILGRTGAITSFNFHSTKGSFNLVSKAYPEVDKWLDDADIEMNESKRIELWAKALKVEADSYTNLGIAEAPSPYALGHKVDWDVPPNRPINSLSYHADLLTHKK